MGLAERRMIAKVDEGLEGVVSGLRSYLGYDIELEIDKASFPENKAVMDGYEYYKEYGFPMMGRILTRIGVDDMGKEALKDRIRKVLVLNTGVDENDGGEKSLSLADGVLTVKQGWYGYSDKLFDEDALLQQIESLL